MPSTPSSTPWCRMQRTTRCSRAARQELHAKIARVIEGALPEHQDHRARSAGPSRHRCGPRRSRTFRSANGWRTGAEAHGASRGHLPSRPGTGTGRLPASLTTSERPANWGCAPSLEQRGWRSKAGRPRKSGPAFTRHLPWRIARAKRRAAVHTSGAMDLRPVRGPRGRVAPVGRGNARRGKGDRRSRSADHGTRGCQLSATSGWASSSRLLEHGDKVRALDYGEKHRHLADIMNHDPKTIPVGAFSLDRHLDAGLPGPGGTTER